MKVNVRVIKSFCSDLDSWTLRRVVVKYLFENILFMINKKLSGGWVVIQRYNIQFRINLIHIIICKSYIDYALSSREYFSSKTFSSLSVKNIKNYICIPFCLWNCSKYINRLFNN